MKQEIVKYETGATSHAVNDLILFTGYGVNLIIAIASFCLMYYLTH